MNFIGLSMSRRIRRTPFTDKVELCGVSDFTVVNHMLMPKSFQSTIEEDYWHLSKHVQIWDVSCQRQVEISGKDAEKLIQFMTPRTITDMSIGQCLYIPLIDENAGMINDPVLLKIKNNKFWLSVADSDVILWTKGLATSLNLNLRIQEPNVYPLAIQGPKSEELMILVFGERIKSIKYFHFDTFNFEGVDQIIARSGYSKQDGFEIYFSGFERGKKLWDHLWSVGNKLNIKPGCPNLIDRIEAGLLSYGNEFTIKNNPYECNFEKYFKQEFEHDFIGKKALNKIKKEGANNKIMGIIFEGNKCPPCSIPFPVYSKDGKKIGQITSAIFSPKFNKNIGLCMILKDYWNVGDDVIVETSDSLETKGNLASLPLI